MADKFLDYKTVGECDAYYSGMIEGFRRFNNMNPLDFAQMMESLEMEHCQAVEEIEDAQQT